MLKRMFIAALVVFGGVGLASMSATPASAQYIPTPLCTVTVLSSATEPIVGQTVSVAAIVQDAAGEPVAAEQCEFSIESQPEEDASVTPTKSLSDEEGVATADVFIGSTPGIVVVQAKCGVCSGQSSFVATGTGETAVLGEVQEPATPAAPPSTGLGQDGHTRGDSWLSWTMFTLALVMSLGAIFLVRRRIPR